MKNYSQWIVIGYMARGCDKGKSGELIAWLQFSIKYY